MSKSGLIKIKSYILKETCGSSCVTREDGVEVQIQGEAETRFIPMGEFFYGKKTRSDPPHFRIRYIEPYELEVELVKEKGDFLVCKDNEGNPMIVPKELRVD